jgi:predicted ArsR family transcriptional regulator
MPESLEIRRVLANPERARLYEALVAIGRARSIEELIEVMALHPNTVRWHLKQLVDVGLVTAEVVHSGGPGRPPIMYTAKQLADSTEEYRLLAGILADSLAGQPQGAQKARAAAAASMAANVTAVRDSEKTRELMVKFMARQGFEPERDGDLISMYRCPFLDIVLKDDQHQAVVCGMHRGLIEGGLVGSESPLKLAEFTPFATPQTCTFRLAATDETKKPQS